MLILFEDYIIEIYFVVKSFWCFHASVFPWCHDVVTSDFVIPCFCGSMVP